MSDPITTVVSPFVKRGLFESPEKAISAMATDYILHQIERYQARIEGLEKKHGMAYEQFDAYLKTRSETLEKKPNKKLGQAIMLEEEDAFDWKVAREMLASWLGLQVEVSK